jgi:2-polyprenyl-6-methoxyphenol hydroxylase-like FAD-dependent oxidoreductase
MEHKGVGLLRHGDRISGVEAVTGEGDKVEILAKLVLACDGRHSITRTPALDLKEYGVPIDVLWFRISRGPGDPDQLLGNINYGRALILINRGDYFQAGLIVPKGSFEDIKRTGLEAFQESLRRIAPMLGARVHELNDWNKVSLLTVRINRLRCWWRPGLLCIGDAAHAMSPAGGVGINLAIQDAVATANLLGDALRKGEPVDHLLARVQQRREFPTRATQLLQVQAHRALKRIFKEPGPIQAPWEVKVVPRIPGVRRLLGRIVGIGFRPEHIRPAQQGRRNEMLRRIAVRAGSMAGEISLMLRRV